MREYLTDTTATESYLHAEPTQDLRNGEGISASYQGSLPQLTDRIPSRNSAGEHASALNRATGSRPSLAGGSMLQLQREYGNRHVQQVLALARQGNGETVVQRDDNDDTQKPPPIVGQDRAVDPKDNICSLQWTLGGRKWMLPSGVACDPGVFGIKGHGDPAKYPSDQPSAPPTSGPALCPDGQPLTPGGKCCPQGQTWDGSQCSAPSAPSPDSCPPDWRTPLGLKCCPPPQVPGSFDCETPQLTPSAAPAPQPGDYEVPDESNTAVA